MSRDVMISFNFAAPLDFETVIDRLALSGWTFLRDGAVWYMVDDFEWKDAPPGHMDAVMREMRMSYEAGEVVAISATIPGEEYSGNLMFHTDRKSVSFAPLLDYRLIPAAPQWVDLSWYIEKLVSSLHDFPMVGITTSDEL
ncbi:hypothetical protein [Microbispora siamensis]|uniref:Uncharacterized protein n=1 Tax=Microbispora siamensis TaxID=564413 RepID=A0ABQ4GP72_9ACTN|nr:hypothetical protein [Microbispora siamensis]GIH63207.1 hypothetical protein Msi02_40240 [Microbispora siamensis]